MGSVNVDLNIVNLNDDKFDDGNPETIIHFRLIVWCINIKISCINNARHVKID